MFGRVYTDVVIVDLSEDGKAYSLADFRQFYLDAKRMTADRGEHRQATWPACD